MGKTPKQFNPTDHDILIRVETLLNETRNDMRSWREEYLTRNVLFEERLRKLEDLSNSLNPGVAHAKYDQVVIEWEAFKNRLIGYGIAVALGGGIASRVGGDLIASILRAVVGM